MTRKLIMLVGIALFASLAFAHGGEEHVVGTVAKVEQNAITVKTTANKMVTVAVAPESKFMKGKAAAKLADLNVGDRVVIHAKEGADEKLVADEVQIGTATTSNSAKTPASAHSH